MDFGIIELEPDLAAFWREDVLPFMDEHLSDEVLEQERRLGNGFVPEYRRALAAKGWLTSGSTDPEAEPSALDPMQEAVVRAEEARRGRSLFPVLGSNELVTSVIAQFGSAELHALVGPGSRRGEIHCCLGYTEPDCGSDAAAVRTHAIRDGDEWVITARRCSPPGADLCQYVCSPRTDLEAQKHQGITMFLVPLHHAGVEVQGIATLGGEHTNFIYFDEARVPDWYRLGPINQGWQVASGALADSTAWAVATPAPTGSMRRPLN